MFIVTSKMDTSFTMPNRVTVKLDGLPPKITIDEGDTFVIPRLCVPL